MTITLLGRFTSDRGYRLDLGHEEITGVFTIRELQVDGQVNQYRHPDLPTNPVANYLHYLLLISRVFGLSDMDLLCFARPTLLADLRTIAACPMPGEKGWNLVNVMDVIQFVRLSRQQLAELQLLPNQRVAVAGGQDAVEAKAEPVADPYKEFRDKVVAALEEAIATGCDVPRCQRLLEEML